MAAGAFTFYDAAKLNLATAVFNFSSGNFNMVLLGSGYTPSVPTDATYASVSGNEVTGTGYSPGGVTLGSLVLPYVCSSNTIPTITGHGTGFPATSTFNLTASGGTSTTAAVINVTTDGSGLVQTVNSVTTQGVYSVLPTNPVTMTGSTGSGCTLVFTWAIAWSSAAASWTSSTITAKYASIIARAGGSLTSTDKLVGYIDLNVGGSAISSTSATFQVSPATVGWFTLE